MSERKLIRFFIEGDDSANILITWWKSLEHERGERAYLRRALNPAEVVFCPMFHQLFGQLKSHGYALGREKADAIATVTGLAAHVKSCIINVSFAQQMATPKSGGDKARVSGLRFRRLLAVKDRDELYPMLIRIVRLLSGEVNLISLANAVFWWNDKTKKYWAYDYYETAPSEK